MTDGRSRRLVGGMEGISKILTAVTTTFSGSSALSGPLVVGAPLPAIEQRDQNDQVVKLAEAGTTGDTLVDFYPKADAPGCTNQAR